MGASEFKKMKPTSIFLNLGRGPIVVEKDLYDALVDGEIAAAGLDVLCKEPMSEDNPLLAIKDSKKLLITPHIAWASVEARTHLMEIVRKHIEKFFNENNYQI
jgi:glycerate dehydrogenase